VFITEKQKKIGNTIVSNSNTHSLAVISESNTPACYGDYLEYDPDRWDFGAINQSQDTQDSYNEAHMYRTGHGGGDEEYLVRSRDRFTHFMQEYKNDPIAYEQNLERSMQWCVWDTRYSRVHVSFCSECKFITHDCDAEPRCYFSGVSGCECDPYNVYDRFRVHTDHINVWYNRAFSSIEGRCLYAWSDISDIVLDDVIKGGWFKV
jgi:hypothetical protein